jgi:predicted enzyme related to lactoylglutathione lyase/quinol monooxygenase YgiN
MGSATSSQTGGHADDGPSGFLSLTSQWFVQPSRLEEARLALQQLAAQVQEGEPDTLIYLVHTPFPNDSRLQSLPPADPASVLFFEVYRDVPAFLRHLNGPIFTTFVSKHGDLFVAANGKPFVFVSFLARQAGFIRPAAGLGAPRAGGTAKLDLPVNRHPAVMFEVIAKDQKRLLSFYQTVFGWSYDFGTGNFAYIKFPAQPLPLLGGIGQATPDVPGFSPGHNFYLQVDDLAGTITRALHAGASALMPPTTIDGYTFAMINDPEGNPLGLIQPFAG